MLVAASDYPGFRDTSASKKTERERKNKCAASLPAALLASALIALFGDARFRWTIREIRGAAAEEDSATAYSIFRVGIILIQASRTAFL